MYFISPMCCICLSTTRNLKPMMQMNVQHLSYYLQLVVSVSELTYKASEYNLVCDECCKTLKSVHDFCLQCLTSRRQIEDYMSQLTSYSTQKGNLTISLLKNFQIKHEVDIEPEVQQQVYDELDINIKEDIDIETHELLLPKTESTEMESNIYSIKSEHVQYSDVDISAAVDPLAVGPCSQLIDSEKQISPGDEVVEKSISDENLLSQTDSTVSTQKKSHQCTICNKKFSQSSHLVTHLRVHTGEKPYECTTCEKKFSQSSHLEKHSRVHTGEKPYECAICNKKFSQSSQLGIHLRVHTGEKPYECTICDKKFSHSTTLSRHLRIHTSEKPYECTLCHKKFSRSSSLVSHSRVHTGEKPYECSVCLKKFSESSNLATHLRVHTGEKPYECTVCNKKFSLSLTLVRHLRIHNR